MGEKTDDKKETKPVDIADTAAKETKSNEIMSPDEQKMNQLNQKKETTYNSLLEKIRQKEKQKALESMIVNSDKEKSFVRMGQYKEAIRFLMHFFQSEKKSTIELEKVIKKMSESSKAQITEPESKEIVTNICSDDKNINLFIDSTSNKKWLNQIKVRNVAYLQMDKSFQINDLNLMVDKAIEKLKV